MKLVSILTIVFLLCACAQDTTAQNSGNQTSEPDQVPAQNLTPPPPQESELTAGKPKMMTLRGTVLYKTMEGGFFGFDADNGRKYTPSGLKAEHRKNGLIIEVTGTINTNMATFQQYGPILMIHSVKVIDDSNVGKNLDNSH